MWKNMELEVRDRAGTGESMRRPWRGCGVTMGTDAAVPDWRDSDRVVGGGGAGDCERVR